MTSLLTEEMAEEHPVILTEYETFLQGLVHAQNVAIDTETTGLRVAEREDYLQGLSLAYRTPVGVFKQYFPFKHQNGNLPTEWLARVTAALKGKSLIFHNRKFDMHSLSTVDELKPVGLDDTVQYDTMLIAHLVNENWPKEKSLENCGQHYVKDGKSGKDEIAKFSKLFGWGAIPPHLMAPYACQDAVLTLKLFEHLWPIFCKKYGPDAIEYYRREWQVQNILYHMEQSGITVNQKFCRQYAAIARLQMDTIEDDLGFIPSKTTALSKFLFDDLELPVLERTPTGKPKLDKKVMEQYETILSNTDDDRAKQVLDYRGWMKASSTFYLPFQTLADSSGRIHCGFKQHGTVTGRLSCATPNLQQIPRESDKEWNGRIRTAFNASPGYVLLGFDYSQLELRLCAAYGQESTLLDIFNDGTVDPFTAYAELIKTDRQTTKTFFYAMLYGAGQERIAITLNRDLKDILVPYANFRQSIPGILRAKALSESKAKQRGYIRLWSGRRRHLSSNETYKAFNSLMQGGGAEIVKRVMIDIHSELNPDECRMLLQVHDELVFEIREDVVDQYTKLIIDKMEQFPTEYFKVPFKVHAKAWS